MAELFQLTELMDSDSLLRVMSLIKIRIVRWCGVDGFVPRLLLEVCSGIQCTIWGRICPASGSQMT